MPGSQDTGLRPTNGALETAVAGPHILLALTFFYELHSMDKDKKEGRHAVVLLRGVSPTVIPGAPCGAM